MIKTLALLTTLTIPSLGWAQQKSDPSLVTRAQEFRALGEQKDYAAARHLKSDGARRWWGTAEGEGSPWSIGPEAPGPWAAWDEHFKSQKEILEWQEGPNSATAIIRETNDYYQLLERGPVTNAVTYYFDDSGKIDGLLIRGLGDRPPGRADEFIAWAEIHEPEELAELMPGGEIDPSGDHPQRFRELLKRWREASGVQSDVEDGRRHFDFLIGDWGVEQFTDADGVVYPGGDDLYSFERILDGAGIFSEWHFNRGTNEEPNYTRGIYVSAFDEMTGTWSFYYFSAQNAMHFQGRKEDGGWYFYHTFNIDGDELLQRQWWTPVDDKTMIRTIENSRDGGETWPERYVRRLTKKAPSGEQKP